MQGACFTRRLFVSGGAAGLVALTVQRRLYAQPSEQTADGFRLLRARAGHAELRGPGRAATAIWGYDGLVPGPLLRVKLGQELRVRLLNELAEPTTIHWHGLRLPNAMDGVPHLTQAPVLPGASFDYRFTPPDAGTFWYRPHADASDQLGRGMAGLLIVDEREPPKVDEDVALVFSEWRLGPNGAIEDSSARHLTVNGRPDLDLAVRANERLRLRLLNACPARLVRIRIERHRVTVMAIDGQPAEPFVARDGAIALGPGNRLDAFVDATLDPGSIAPILLSDFGSEVAIARLVYHGGAAARAEPRPDPAPLSPNPLPARMNFAGALKLDVPLGGDAAGGFVPKPGQPLFRVKGGRTVMLAFHNRTPAPHAIHVHGHHVRLLDKLDDGWKPFWLDTVLSLPSDTTRIAFVADNPGKWALQARSLGGEGAGLTAWFEVG